MKIMSTLSATVRQLAYTIADRLIEQLQANQSTCLHNCRQID